MDSPTRRGAALVAGAGARLALCMLPPGLGAPLQLGAGPGGGCGGGPTQAPMAAVMIISHMGSEGHHQTTSV